jgi:hypothetical protein
MCDPRGMRIALLVVLLAACGDDGPVMLIDANPGIDAPYDVNRCLIQGFYGQLGPKTGTTSQGVTTSTIVLDPGPPRDSFFLKLNAGKGVFSAGLAAGTYPIAGAELSQSTCGACVNIIADIVTMQGPTKFYFATGGSLTLTATSPPAGSLSAVTFQEVDAGGGMITNGCTARIDAMSFTTN